jgi:hypothetical protein
VLIKTKPRIIDTGLYSLSNRFEKGCIRGWLPGSSTQRTKSASEIIPCFFRYNHKKKVLLRGEKPATFTPNKAITKRDWERSLKPKKANPIEIGTRFLEYLNENPGSTYDDIAEVFGVSKARVCQMLALCNRLPEQITNYLLNADEPDILKHFTERKLRPLTLMESDDEKINRFSEMKAELSAN